MKLSVAIRQFLEYCEIDKNQAQKTIITYAHYLQRFLEFAGDIELEKIDLALVKKYRLFLNRLEFRLNEPLSIKSQSYHVIGLRAFLKWCVKQNLKTLEPEKIELPKMPERRVEYLTREELERLFRAIDSSKIIGLRNRAILEMLYSTGLRVSELVNLNRDQINLKQREFQVRGKGQKMRIVFLSQRAADWISAYLEARKDQYDPLFLNHHRARRDGGRRLTEYTIQEMARVAAATAGIVKKVTPHKLRHSFATELLMNGADIRSVQEMLGHSSITTTQIYTHITNKKLREVHEAFHK